MALRNMLKRKLRTFLTLLGVAIGAAAITVMISLGLAVNMNIDEQFTQIGHQALRIQIHGGWDEETWESIRTTQALVDALNEHPNVRIATPVMEHHLSLSFRVGMYVSQSVAVIGMTPEAMDLFGFTVAEGRNLNSDDEMQIVFGSEVHRSFHNPRNPGGNTGGGGPGVGRGDFIITMPDMPGASPGPGDTSLTINLLEHTLRAHYDHRFVQTPPLGGAPPGQGGNLRPYFINAVGILEAGGDWQTMHSAFMPLDQLRSILEDRDRAQGNHGGQTDQTEDLGTVWVLVDYARNIRSVTQAIQDAGMPENGFWYMGQWIHQQHQTTETLNTLLTAMGGVVLLVAAIGIMAIMIMSIYERTREIGVMKVIGASIADIRRLFLFEAAFIGALGGAVGIGLSYGVSYILNNLDNFEIFGGGGGGWWGQIETTGLVSYIPSWLYLLAFGFSAVVGLISGFLPALRATRISALAAIRTD